MAIHLSGSVAELPTHVDPTAAPFHQRSLRCLLGRWCTWSHGKMGPVEPARVVELIRGIVWRRNVRLKNHNVLKNDVAIKFYILSLCDLSHPNILAETLLLLWVWCCTNHPPSHLYQNHSNTSNHEIISTYEHIIYN